jgi:hypothetical protein
MRVVAVAGALLSLAVVVAVSCGGDGVTLEEYFEELQAITDDAAERDEALDEEFDALGAAASEAAALAELQELFRRLADIFGDSLSAVRAVEAPTEVADLHEEFISGLAEVAAAVDRFAGLIGDAESEAEVDGVIDSFQFDEPAARFERACIRMEGVAQANGIEVDLECGVA